MPRTISVPSNLISFSKSFDLAGEWVGDQEGGGRKNYWEVAIFIVSDAGRRLNAAGFSIGIIPEGFAHRQVCQGPLVPGPWGWIGENCAVIDDCGGTGAINDKARQEGRLFEVEVGDILEIDGNHYRIDPPGKYADRTHIRLTLVESPAAVA